MRNTPCVAGCDGPMFRTIFSPCMSCKLLRRLRGARGGIAEFQCLELVAMH